MMWLPMYRKSALVGRPVGSERDVANGWLDDGII